MRASQALSAWHTLRDGQLGERSTADATAGAELTVEADVRRGTELFRCVGGIDSGHAEDNLRDEKRKVEKRRMWSGGQSNRTSRRSFSPPDSHSLDLT